MIFRTSPEKLAHAIVAALEEALEHDMPDIMADFELTDRLGYGQFRWNPIISRLQKVCNHLGYMEFGRNKRGAWTVPILFNPLSGMLFTLMTEKRLKEVQRDKRKGLHYLCGASSFNEGMLPIEEQLELELPEIAPDLTGWIAKTRTQLVDPVKASVGDIKGHTLIVFDVQGDKLISVRAVRLTVNLEEAIISENWSHFIRKPYAATDVVEPQINHDDDDDEMLVDLILE